MHSHVSHIPAIFISCQIRRYSYPATLIFRAMGHYVSAYFLNSFWHMNSSNINHLRLLKVCSSCEKATTVDSQLSLIPVNCLHLMFILFLNSKDYALAFSGLTYNASPSYHRIFHSVINLFPLFPFIYFYLPHISSNMFFR